MSADNRDIDLKHAMLRSVYIRLSVFIVVVVWVAFQKAFVWRNEFRSGKIVRCAKESLFLRQ